MCPAALSSLHVRARMECASAASSASALACTQQLVVVPKERKPSTGRSHTPSPSPSWDHVGRIRALIYHPRCAPTGKIFQHFCVSRFFPQERYREAAEMHGSACPCARARTTIALGWWASPHLPSTHGTVEALLLPCSEGFTQVRILSLKHDMTKLISLQGNVDPHCSLPTGSP